MEKNKKEKIEFDMYDFILESETKYASMYEIIGQYFPELNGNYSTVSFINKFLEVAENNASRNFVEKKYNVSFDELSQILLVANQGSQKPEGRLTDKEKIDILVKLNEAANGLYECKDFTTIEEFVKYAKENLGNENSRPLRDEVVNAAVYVANRRYDKGDNEGKFISLENYRKVQQLKFDIIKMYTAWASNHVRDKYDQFQRANEYVHEWEIMKFVQKTLSKKDDFDLYDEDYTAYVEDVDSYKKKRARQTSYKGKRARSFLDHIKSTLTPEELNKAREEGWESVLTHRRSGTTIPYEGTVDWYFEAFEKPQLICDTIVKYSPNGDDYQRVVMISYGKFHYNDGLFDSGIVQSELVGISRLGNDDVYSYSKIIPLDTISFRETNDIKEGEGTVTFTGVNGKEITVRDDKNRNVLYGFHSKKIPKDFRYSFVADYTSDRRLELFDKNGIEFLGIPQRSGSGIKFENEDLAGAEAKAVAYACKYPQHNLKGKENLRQIKALIREKHTRLVAAAMISKFDTEVEKQSARVGYIERDTGLTTYSKDPIEIEGDELI